MQLQGGAIVKVDDNIQKCIRVILCSVMLRQLETPLILREGVWQHVWVTSPSQTILKIAKWETLSEQSLVMKCNWRQPVNTLPCHYCCCCLQWTLGWGSAWDCSSSPVSMITAGHKTLLIDGWEPGVSSVTPPVGTGSSGITSGFSSTLLMLMEAITLLQQSLSRHKGAHLHWPESTHQLTGSGCDPGDDSPLLWLSGPGPSEYGHQSARWPAWFGHNCQHCDTSHVQTKMLGHQDSIR